MTARLPIRRVPAEFAEHLNQVYGAARDGSIQLDGQYASLGEAHDAVIAWCRAHGRTRTGTRWEVYGHWSDDPARSRTDVYYLLEPK